MNGNWADVARVFGATLLILIFVRLLALVLKRTGQLTLRKVKRRVRRPRRPAGRILIILGAVLAIVGFLFIDNYHTCEFGCGIVWNIMRDNTIFGVPYRYLLVFSVVIIGFGLYRLSRGGRSAGSDRENLKDEVRIRNSAKPTAQMPMPSLGNPSADDRSAAPRTVFAAVDEDGNRRIAVIHENGVEVFDRDKSSRLIKRTPRQIEDLLDWIDADREDYDKEIKIDGRWYRIDDPRTHEIEEQTTDKDDNGYELEPKDEDGWIEDIPVGLFLTVLILLPVRIATGHDGDTSPPWLIAMAAVMLAITIILWRRRVAWRRAHRRPIDGSVPPGAEHVGFWVVVPKLRPGPSPPAVAEPIIAPAASRPRPLLDSVGPASDRGRRGRGQDVPPRH